VIATPRKTRAVRTASTLAAVLTMLEFMAPNSTEAQLPLEVEFESGFTSGTKAAKRREAFNIALDLWSKTLSGNIPIKVRAVFEDMNDPDALARGGATRVVRINGIDVTAPLASQLDGVSYVATTGENAGFHVITRFDSADDEDFYYGNDGNPPSGQVDFIGISFTS